MFQYILVALLATRSVPTSTAPLWLISPNSNSDNLIQARGATFDRSNNNVAIKIYKGRLYLAVRTARHHHPRPPIWAKSSGKSSGSRMYVLSCPFSEKERQQLSDGKAKAWSWTLEFEVSQQLEQGKLGQLRTALSSDEKQVKKQAGKEMISLLGRSPQQVPAEGYLKNCDLREPIFFQMNGELHLLYLQVAGVSMQFTPLRAWHTRLKMKGKWTAPTPILKPGDHFWSVRVQKDKQGQVAYLSYARGGGHYEFGGTKNSNGFVDLSYSRNGQDWKSVSGDKGVDQGRACEPVLGFSPRGDKAWMLLRCEDADPRGWGSLLGWATTKHLDKWTFPKDADPRRFDSARFFNVGEETYVIARQRLAKKSGPWDQSRNAPYGPETKPPKDGADLHSLVLMAGYAVSPMRTALYKLDPGKPRLDHVLTLPSAGDTAFPSIERLDSRTVLVANYSSPLEDPAIPWLEGQNGRTGVYLMTLQFPEK